MNDIKSEAANIAGAGSRGVAVTISFILFVSCVVALWFRVGPSGTDDPEYIRAVMAIAQSGLYELGPGSVRLALLALPTVAYMLSNQDLGVMFLSFLLYHPAIVFLTYRLGSTAHTAGVGLFAALCVALSPLVASYATTFFPDAPLTIALLLTVIAVLKAHQLPQRRGALHWVMAGLATGIAYSIKISGLLLVVPIGVWMVVRRSLTMEEKIRSIFLYSAGVFFVLVVETGLLWILEPGTQFQPGFIAQLRLLSQSESHFAMLPGAVGLSVWERLQAIFGFLSLGLYGAPYIVPAVALLYPFLRRRSLLVWGVCFWWISYSWIGTVSWHSFVPPPMDQRYVLPLIPLISVQFAALVSTFSGRLRYFNFAGYVLTLIVAVFSFWSGRSWGGQIERASQFNAALSATAYSTLKYPEYPILYSPYFSERYGPLLQGTEYDRLFLFSQSSQIKLPFLYIRPAASSLDHGTEPFLSKFPETKIRFERLFNVTATRMWDLRSEFKRLLLLPDVPDSADTWGAGDWAVVLDLVSEFTEGANEPNFLFDSAEESLKYRSEDSRILVIPRGPATVFQLESSLGTRTGIVRLRSGRSYLNDLNNRALKIVGSPGAYRFVLQLRAPSGSVHLTTSVELLKGGHLQTSTAETATVSDELQVLEINLHSAGAVDEFALAFEVRKEELLAWSSLVIERITLTAVS